MPVSKVFYGLALALFLPAAAHADPVNVTLQSTTGVFTDSGTSTGWFSIDLGNLSLGSTNPSGLFLVSGLRHGSDYSVSLTLPGRFMYDSLRLEVLDPLGDGDDRLDPAPQPAYVPAGFSTSNTRDGFSFAQDSALVRSATFVGGSGTVTADEVTNRGDILSFSGLTGADNARILFGLRDRIGGRGFLVRISVLGNASNAPVPEPASMLLVGSGLFGLATAYRKRKLASS